MKLPRLALLLGAVLACGLTHPSRGQTSGASDVSFAAGSVVNSTVRAVVGLPDGKMLIGGDFTTVRGAVRSRIARLNADGSVDASFDPGSGVVGSVYSLALQSDGKVLLGGFFGTNGAPARNYISRLNADGSLDTSFDAGSGPNNGIFSLALQSDGKVLVAGAFSTINGTARNRIARLNANGSLDTSFDPGTGANGTVYSLAPQSDGKVLLGGDFTAINGTAINRIARLNANGTLDMSFFPGSGANNSVDSIAVQSDGKVLLGGGFTTVYNITRRSVARLNANGSLDTSFDPGTGPNSDVRVTLQSDGKVLLGGGFTTVNGTARNRIARLNANGSLDTSFDPGTGANDWIYCIAVQSDGKVLLGGDLTTIDGAARTRIARLNANGSLDTSFDPSSGANSAVYSLALQSDGKVLVGGSFIAINSTPRSRVARLNADGSVDPSFDPGTGANSTVTSLAVQTDGKVLLGGYFTTINGTARNRIARLNADGSLDTSFDPGTGANDWIQSLAVQSDGKVLVGGVFSTINGTARNYIARLDANGSLDMSFDPGTGMSDAVRSLAVQSDGKVLVGGGFSTINGTARNRIARLNADGSLDMSFDPGAGTYGVVNSLAVQPDGKVLVGGSFSTMNGTVRDNIARLNADGSLDMSFDPGIGASNQVFSVALQSDGKVLLGGDFNTVNGTARIRIARLNADGSLDTSFDPGIGADGYVYSLALQSDGKVLVGGAFITMNGQPRSYLDRLQNDPAVSQLVAKNQTQAIWYRDGAAPEVEQVRFELSIDGGSSWAPLGSGVCDGKQWVIKGLSLPISGQLRATGRTTGGYFSGSFGLVAEVTSYLIDIIPPTVSPVMILSSNTNSAVAKAGDTITLSFTASEPIQQPTVTLLGASAVATNIDANRWQASATVDAGSAEGAVTFSITAADLADNNSGPVTSTTDGSSVTVDLAAPGFDAVTIASSNATSSGIARAGDSITVSFSTSEPIAAPSVSILGVAASVTGVGTGWQASVPVAAETPEGPVSFVIQASDAAGNSTSRSSTTDGNSVTVDHLYPPTAVTSAAANIGATRAMLNGTVANPEVGAFAVSYLIGTSNPPNQEVLLENLDVANASIGRFVGGLTPATQYFFRITATNPNGTTLGEVLSFTTQGVGTDTKTPIVKIVAPATRTVPGAFAISGTVREDKELASFSVILNGAPVTLATDPLSPLAPFAPNTDTLWSAANVQPENGTNTIVVEATDASGRLTRVTKVVTYTNTRPLLAGSFDALLLPADTPDMDTAGLINLTVTATGAFTGKATISGMVVPFSGTLKNDGGALFKPTWQEKLALIDQTDFDSYLGALTFSVTEADGISGTLATQPGSGAVLASFAGKKAPYSATQLVSSDPRAASFLNQPGRGTYTVAFPAREQTPARPASSYPQGTGAARLTLRDNGAVSVSGYLADGTKYTASGKLRTGGTVALFTQLYRKRGAFGGELLFSNQPDTDVAGGNFLWLREPIARVQYYPAGWPNGVLVDAVGTKYSTPASFDFGQGIADLTNGNATLSFSGGALTSSINKLVSIDLATGAAKVIPATNTTFTVRLAPKNGTLTGSVLREDGKRVGYKGVLLNKGGNQGGFGYFLSIPALTSGGSGLSGAMSLTP